MIYDKNYFKGNSKHCGSDICKKFDMHWWSYRYYSSLVKKYLKNGSVLELGCAHGYLLSFLSEKKYQKYGKDISGYAIGYAKKNNPQANFFLGSVEKLNEIEDETMDLVIAKYVLEHLDDPENCIEECRRILKNGGYFIFSVPNTSSILKELKKDQWIGCRDKTHKSVFTPEEWDNLLEKRNFKIIKKFSDGFWDVPYIKYVPNIIQLLFFGWVAILQTFFIGQWIPVKFGENLIVIAKKYE